MKLVDAVKIPLTDTARDSLIAMSVLWIFFTAAVGFRIYGRMRGPGIGLDDIFAIVAVVRNPLLLPPLHLLDIETNTSIGLDHRYRRSKCCRWVTPLVKISESSR
jgi:hypothetical protein